MPRLYHRNPVGVTAEGYEGFIDAAYHGRSDGRAGHASLRLLCFGSTTVPAGDGVRALGDGGRYATFERDDGKEKPRRSDRVRPGPGNVYEFVNEKGVATPVTFHPLAGDEHIAQVRLEGGAGYGYVLARVASPKEIVIVPAECSKQDAAKMQALGVVPRNQFECRIDKVGDPVAFFVGLKRSAPVSRMVRE